MHTWSQIGEQNTSSKALKFYDFSQYYGDKLERHNLASFFQKIEDGKLSNFKPTAFSLVHTSTLLNQSDVDEIYQNQKIGDVNGLQIINFFKKKCKSCSAIKPFFEEFATTVASIQDEISSLEANGQTYDYRYPGIMNKYGVRNPQNFKNLQISRFDVYNDVRTIYIPNIY